MHRTSANLTRAVCNLGPFAMYNNTFITKQALSDPSYHALCCAASTHVHSPSLVNKGRAPDRSKAIQIRRVSAESDTARRRSQHDSNRGHSNE